jgi:hypothetical protein
MLWTEWWIEMATMIRWTTRERSDGRNGPHLSDTFGTKCLVHRKRQSAFQGPSMKWVIFCSYKLMYAWRGVLIWCIIHYWFLLESPFHKTKAVLKCKQTLCTFKNKQCCDRYMHVSRCSAFSGPFDISRTVQYNMPCKEIRPMECTLHYMNRGH